jgi:hypothetical protein
VRTRGRFAAMICKTTARARRRTARTQSFLEDERKICEHPIHPLLAGRRSIRAFASTPVEPETLASLMEAARWAPSCMNEQPWSFIAATKANKSDFDRLLGCLVEFNVEWAQHAPVLLLSVAKLTFESTGTQPARIPRCWSGNRQSHISGNGVGTGGASDGRIRCRKSSPRVFDSSRL